LRLPHSLIATLCAGVIAAPLLAAAPARAQEVESREAIALRDQIAELRQEIQMMQQAQQSGGPVPSNLAPPPQQMEPPPGQAPAPGGNDSLAELVVRVSSLEEQNRQLLGRVDDLANQLQRQNDTLTKQIGDLAFKLGQGGPGQLPGGDAGTAPDSGGVPPPPGEVAGLIAPPQPNAVAPRPVVPPVRRTPEMALRDGAAALARRDYAAAEALAREALASHGPRSNDAQFLLARAEAGQRKYREATADFYLAYNHAPKSPSAPIALLGVANSLIALNDSHDACEALAKLSVEFPHPSEGVRAGVAGARKRAACAR
jgi:TolA-binding protein